jgi:hypothetical protein
VWIFKTEKTNISKAPKRPSYIARRDKAAKKQEKRLSIWKTTPKTKRKANDRANCRLLQKHVFYPGRAVFAALSLF